jgi:hypothetical protein
MVGTKGDPLVAKGPKEKCINAEVNLMIRNIEDLHEIWSTLDV